MDSKRQKKPSESIGGQNVVLINDNQKGYRSFISFLRLSATFAAKDEILSIVFAIVIISSFVNVLIFPFTVLPFNFMYSH